MTTVKDMIESLLALPPDTPVVIRSLSSGVVEEAGTASMTDWVDRDNDYGIFLPVGTRVAVIYMGA